MRFAYKQLTRQIGHNKVFVVSLLILAAFTSLLFFFVKFSVDKNMMVLDSLSALSENQAKYKNALDSNTSLAYTCFIAMTGLTAFAFIMFFYRFFRTNKKQIGCLKALGFKDYSLCMYFVLFVAVLSTIGAWIGLLAGYFLSDILIRANEATYSVTGLIKGIHFISLTVGLLASTVVYCLTALLGYSYVRGKEPGVLIAGKNNRQKDRFTLQAANRIVQILPIKDKAPLRIALRKPLAVLLLFVAVTAFSVCIILGQSLNISSQKIFHSQTMGHNYEFDTRYPHYLEKTESTTDLPYLYTQAELAIADYDVQQTMIGLDQLNDLYVLQDADGRKLSVPPAGTIYVNPGLAEIYGVHVGDSLALKLDNKEYNFIVSEIAINAKSASIFVNARELTKLLSLAPGSYNGIWSTGQVPSGGSTIDRAAYLDALERDAVSNKTSAVINQVIGGIVGCILIFLALYVNFQDNTRDMLILHSMGYGQKTIYKMLVDIYRPLICILFLLTIVPSIFMAGSIQKSLSISTNDYMPFGTSILVILLIFVLLNVIYQLVLTIFSLSIKRVIRQESVLELIASE